MDFMVWCTVVKLWEPVLLAICKLLAANLMHSVLTFKTRAGRLRRANMACDWALMGAKRLTGQRGRRSKLVYRRRNMNCTRVLREVTYLHRAQLRGGSTLTRNDV